MLVRVFRNLNKGCMSVIAMQGPFKGKVIAHAHSAYLHNCKMIVSEASRQRVIKEKTKNVHAWVQGELQCLDLISLRYDVKNLPVGLTDHVHPIQVRYNPYERGEFYFATSKEAVFHCDCAEVRSDGVWLE